MTRVLALVGGIARDSINRKLAGFVAARAGARFSVDLSDVARLPHFSQDLEGAPPAPVVDFRAAVAGADAVLVVTPEYNRSLPGVLKNALDWASRPQNLWAGKPAAIMGASPGAIGTFGAQQHGRLVMSFLGMRTMPQPEFYFTWGAHVDDAGALKPDAAKFLDGYLDAFARWIDTVRG